MEHQTTPNGSLMKVFALLILLPLVLLGAYFLVSIVYNFTGASEILDITHSKSVSSPTPTTQLTPVNTITPTVKHNEYTDVVTLGFNYHILPKGTDAINSNRIFDGTLYTFIRESRGSFVPSVDYYTFAKVVSGKVIPIKEGKTDLERMGVKLAQYVDASTADFYIDTNLRRVYLIKALTERDLREFQPHSEMALVADFSSMFNDSEVVNFMPEWITIGSYNVSLYSSSHYYAYYPTQDVMLITASGGDSCAAWGSMYKADIANRIITKVTELNGGCSKGVRLIGVHKGWLVLADASILEGRDETMSLAVINRLFLLDPITLDGKVLVEDFSSKYGYFDRYLGDSYQQQLQSNEVALIETKNATWSQNDIYAFNIETLKMRKLGRVKE